MLLGQDSMAVISPSACAGLIDLKVRRWIEGRAGPERRRLVVETDVWHTFAITA